MTAAIPVDVSELCMGYAARLGCPVPVVRLISNTTTANAWTVYIPPFRPRVYLTAGLLDRTGIEVEAVMAHEMIHISLRHTIKRLALFYSSALLALALCPLAGPVGGVVALAASLALWGLYVRHTEYVADRLSTRLTPHPYGLLRYLLRLHRAQQRRRRTSVLEPSARRRMLAIFAKGPTHG